MGLGTKCLLVTVAAWVIFKLISFDTEVDYRELLNNKNIIITGASSGIGEQAAIFCAQNGANVVIVARRETLLQKVVTKLHRLSPSQSPKIKYIIADFSDPKVSKYVIKDAETFLGTIDYLMINHAFLPSTFDHMLKWVGTDDQHDQLNYAMQTNFYSYVTLADHAVPLLNKTNGGLLVISSMIVDTPAYNLPYSSSKGAVNTFFTGLRQEFMKTNTNVSITLVHMGFVETESALKTLKYLSDIRQVDIASFIKSFPTITPIEAGKAVITAMLKQEPYFYYPPTQRLRFFRVFRHMVRDPDYWMDAVMETGIMIIKWKKVYLW